MLLQFLLLLVAITCRTAKCSTSESVRRVDALCATHTYTVVGYTLARAMGAGTRLCSDVFEVGGQLFRLEVYPAGLNAETNTYLSLFLTTSGSARPGHLLYEISILDRGQSNPEHITESRTAFPPSPFEPATIQAPYAGVVAGFPKFIKANFLHRNPRRFLRNDTLTIRATVKALTGWSSFPVPPSAEQPQLYTVHQPAAVDLAGTALGMQALPCQLAACPAGVLLHVPGPAAYVNLPPTSACCHGAWRMAHAGGSMPLSYAPAARQQTPHHHMLCPACAEYALHRSCG